MQKDKKECQQCKHNQKCFSQAAYNSQYCKGQRQQYSDDTLKYVKS